MNANNEEEVKEKTGYIIEFLKYAEKWNKENKIFKYKQQKNGQFVMPIRNIYIKIGEERIYPYNSLFQTEDEIMKEAMRKN
ncbi:MAG: hypothetical protein HFJ50_05920 [Clostridia bacterium]|jgi:hypothetical protein|nr:hypothetical protein [Clostridia bacterium]